MFVKDGRRGSWLSRGWSLFWLVWVDAVFVLTFAFGLVHCGGWLVVMVAGCKRYLMLDSIFFLYGYGGQWSCWFVVVQFRGGSDGRDYKVET